MKESCLTDLRKRRIGAPTLSTSALKIGPGATGKSVALFSQIVKECIAFSRLVDLGRAPAAQAGVPPATSRKQFFRVQRPLGNRHSCCAVARLPSMRTR